MTHPTFRRAFAAFTVLAILCVTLHGGHVAAAQGSRVDQLMAQMSLEQKVGQLFMVAFYGRSLNDATRAFLQEMQPGGFTLFASNATDAVGATRVINEWQTANAKTSPIPLLVATDHEGGTVVRLEGGFSALPYGSALSAMPTARAEQVGRIAAKELRAVGIGMNLAPVADLRVTKAPRFMDRRVFGHDPTRVAAAVAAYTRGLQRGQVAATLKHFPGHGAATDSHDTVPVLPTARKDLERELAPFRAGIAAGASAVMIGHLSLPALDPSGVPATFSKPIVTDLLRREMLFGGVIMTDALDMGAIVKTTTAAEAALKAFQAGVDMLTTGPKMPLNDQRAMKRAILDAVLSGEIEQTRLDDSVRRILNLKLLYGLLDWTPLDPDTAATRIGLAEHAATIDQIYLDTFSVVYDEGRLLPVSGKQIGIIYPGVYPSVRRVCDSMNPSTRALAFSLTPTPEELLIARQVGQRTDVVLIFTFNVEDYPRQADLVRQIPANKAVVVAMQNPYDVEQLDPPPIAYAAMFNPYPGAIRAACEVLFGSYPPIGVFGLR
jgi:beta-N-acetylhexosaminidase